MSPQRRSSQGPPINLTGPSAQGTVHVDVAPPAAVAGSSSSNHNHDVAGVLRRNQACLQCRKRKLKCDAARPHCATCVRSYRHSLRTAPKTNPVLCCDYDDSTSGQHEDGVDVIAHHSVSPSAGTEDDDNGVVKKKRKATGEGKRKKKDEEFEEERDRLTKQIEELQAQLSQNKPAPPPQQQWVDGPSVPVNKTWSSTAQPFQDATIAPSPTAFLEMLSSAATAQGSNSGQQGQQGQQAWWSRSNSDLTNPGPMFGIDSQNGQHSGNINPIAPLFPFSTSQQEATIDAIDVETSSETAEKQSRRTSAQDDISPDLDPTAGSSTGVSILSPNGVFNFSPGDTTENNLWPPPLTKPDGHIEPSTRLDGPWRAVETVEGVFASGMAAAAGSGPDAGMDLSGDFNLDGLQAGLDAAVQEQLFMDLFWPGWPNNLPEPNVVNDLIEAFFDFVPNLPRMLHRARFLARMALPPTHSNFPHPALIHAVCAAAAAWCPPHIYEKSKKAQQWAYNADVNAGIGVGMYGGREDSGGAAPKAQLSFGLRQASFAKEAVTDGLNTGNRLFDVVRAMIILCRVFIDDTRMLECWSYGGLVARMILPLGLNVRSAELSLKSVMLPPPADALEREERRAAIWMAFYHDSIASAASGWGTSIALDELTVPLPVSAKDFELGEPYMVPNPQDLESPDFWIKHPVVDSFVMVTKAALLVNRVNRFARKWKNRHLRDNDDFDGMNKPEFRELANAIACFQMSFPPSLRNYCKLTAKGSFDIDLIAAHMLPYTAIICLYEPFSDCTDPTDQAARRILNASQGIGAIVQQLAGTVNRFGSNFASEMHASVSVCLVTGARTFLVFIRHALNIGDDVTAQTYRTEVETIRIALSQYGLRFKIGHHHAQLIEYFMDRCFHPTYDKLSAHYPEHPRPGAPELRRDSNMGLCVMNALNVKRGFWRMNKSANTTSTGVSPLQSTPESSTSIGTGSGFSNNSGRSGSASTANTSIHTSNANGEGKDSPTSLTPEDQARFAATHIPRPDGHVTLLFGQTEDDAVRFYADRAAAAAREGGSKVDGTDATVPSTTDLSMMDILNLWHGDKNGGKGDQILDTFPDTMAAVPRPGYGIDANGTAVSRPSCVVWPGVPEKATDDLSAVPASMDTYPFVPPSEPNGNQAPGHGMMGMVMPNSTEEEIMMFQGSNNIGIAQDIEKSVGTIAKEIIDANAAYNRFDQTRRIRPDGHRSIFVPFTEEDAARFQRSTR